MALPRHDVAVEMRLMAPITLEAPAKCRPKIARSMEAPEWCPRELRGGYSVQPVAGPPSTRILRMTQPNEAGITHRARLLRRGNLMSALPVIIGSSQLPKPLMSSGMTRKKIMSKACMDSALA